MIARLNAQLSKKSPICKHFLPIMPLKLFTMEARGTFSKLQQIRKTANNLLPAILEKGPHLEIENHEALGAVADHEDIKKCFPHTYGRARISLKECAEKKIFAPLRVGVVLSGGQAPGGHNVIAGIYDYIKKVNADSVMIGFLDGPQGIYNGEYCIVDDKLMDQYRNAGGFDMIGSGRHKIEKPAEFEAAMENCIALNLDGVVVIGGDDSNTNGAVLAEYFEAHNCKTKVCGAPKTIDGDLKVDPYIPISFGFDTACRTYSELIGNLGQDTLSSQKYYHFVRLMGRAASNIALECALQTRPNVCLISEEIEAKKMTLLEITKEVVAVILARAEQGKDYGIVLLPEGLIEFIPEFNQLISEINDVLAKGTETTEAAVTPFLSDNNKAVFAYLPENIKQQLLLDRDPHGNVQVAKIETERLLAQTVSMELESLRLTGAYKGQFTPIYHSYGYEGRSGLPSSFDATYCYVLGQNVGAMLSLGCNGLISSVTNLEAPVSEWKCGGVPITMMCHMEKRHGHMKPVIKKALVELDGEPFKCFAAQRADWAIFDLYRSPGPIQYFTGSNSVELCVTLTLELLKGDTRMSLTDIEAAKKVQKQAVRCGNYLFSPVSGDARAILSVTQKERALFKPTLCGTFASATGAMCEVKQATQCCRVSDKAVMKSKFPLTYGSSLISIENGPAPAVKVLKIGVAFCGRQAPGGHDVIAGLFDAIPSGSTLTGFIGGTVGLVANHGIAITAAQLEGYRGGGGSELLCRSIENIDSLDFEGISRTCTARQLDGLVLVGGARTNTVAAYLAEYLLSVGCTTKIVTTPVDCTGAFRNEFVETTVGFNTCTKVAGQIVGNNATDGASAKKYYYFMRLLGSSPSHSTLEVALITKPNFVILAEEVVAKNMTLADIVRSIADIVSARAADGKNYGTVLIPEGLVDSIPELRLLISEIDGVFAECSNAPLDASSLRSKLTIWSKALLDSLPDFMQSALLLSRGSDTHFQVSQAETERLLAHFVDIELGYRKKKGTYKGSFSVVCSFIGYQTRGAAPSNFDVNYAYNLGFTALRLVVGGFSGYMASMGNLKEKVASWQPMGVPITALMTCETQGHVHLPAVPKTTVDLNGPAFAALEEMRRTCSVLDKYENPGPLQFRGPSDLVDGVTSTLTLESFSYMHDIKKLQVAMSSIQEACRPGCPATVMHIATRNLETLNEIITLVQSDASIGTKRVRADTSV